jgi:hypothetical protein
LATQGFYADLASHMDATEDNSGWLGDKIYHFLFKGVIKS